MVVEKENTRKFKIMFCVVHEHVKETSISWRLECYMPRSATSQLNEIWDALRAAAEADLSLAQAIVDSAGVIVQNPDLTVCYDERGAKYELPKYVLSEPTNLIHDS
ncbi:ubiquitin domain-containing protein 2 isoform X2 [Sesamum indicum]|uniref:Ubiquitin domain-containing protein 2 isoform X2 n=1 Tax=Sesamum indicum TaxID=4182 RepID=A0A8M8V5F5_SESIN|nr:ubiquitin domain-containing protein 2 isoform X2 [Sesamum indicum]